jgi:hypothetical protein
MSNTETETVKGKAPTHIVYHVRENEDKGFWTRIGAAWPHKDGKGFNVSIDCVPLDGKISLRIPSDKE